MFPPPASFTRLIAEMEKSSPVKWGCSATSQGCSTKRSFDVSLDSDPRGSLLSSNPCYQQFLPPTGGLTLFFTKNMENISKELRLLFPTPELPAIYSYHCLLLLCLKNMFLLNEGWALSLCSGSCSNNNS